MFNNKPHIAPLGNVPSFTPPKQRPTNNIKAGIYDSNPTYPTIFANPVTSVDYVVNITDDFDAPHVYDSVVALLISATEMDTITYNINSDGGYVKSLNMLVGFKQMCKAKQIHVLMGEASSAATSFFLSEADQYIVGDRASFMIHEYQVNNGGTMSNSKRRNDFSSAECEKWVRDSYEGFLSEQEITDVLNGVEIYLNAEEIRTRLSKREEMKAEKAAQDIQKALETPIDLSEYSLEELEEELGLMTADLRDLKAEINKRKKLRDIPPYNPEPLREVVETTVKKRKTTKEKQNATDASTVD